MLTFYFIDVRKIFQLSTIRQDGKNKWKKKERNKRGKNKYKVIRKKERKTSQNQR